jgi:alkanesulfonate monooxygenase SsuD/methylene tetrahydromethanopterin reductase-like flavin-dependent oxidoreductase (luciferase family)
MHIAEQASMIDHLSRGRLVMTVAMGYHEDYWRMFGMNRLGRRDRFIESVEIMRRAFASPEPFSYDGAYYQLYNVRLTPPPYQPGGPEVWLGGQANASIERAGVYGDGWCVDLYPVDPATWRERVDLYRSTAERCGRKTNIMVLREAWISDSHEETKRFCEYVAAEQRYSYEQNMPLQAHPDFLDPEAITPERWAEHAIVGTPEECAEKMIRMRDYMGFDEICLRLRRPMGPSFEETLEVLQRFGEEVIPLVDAV